jgi:hypothetical protein
MIGSHQALNGERPGAVTVRAMGWWYWIGVSVGFGAAAGVVLSGLPLRRTLPLTDALGALLVGGLVGLSIAGPHRGHWSDAAGGAAGCLAAYLGAAVIVAGAFRRGGTRVGLAVLMFGIALVAAAIAFIPAAGFVEAIALPTLAWRLRRMQPERYAGLRTLAKD